MERTDSAAGLDNVTYSAYGIERSWRGDLARVRYGRWEGARFVALGAVTVRTWPDRLPADALSGHLAGAAAQSCANGQAPDWRAIVAEVSTRTCTISLHIVDVWAASDTAEAIYAEMHPHQCSGCRLCRALAEKMVGDRAAGIRFAAPGATDQHGFGPCCDLHRERLTGVPKHKRPYRVFGAAAERARREQLGLE